MVKCSLPGTGQTNWEHSNVEQVKVYQNCNFYDPRDRGFLCREWQCKSYGERALFLKKSSSLLQDIVPTNCVHSNNDQVRVYPWDRGSCAKAWP